MTAERSRLTDLDQGMRFHLDRAPGGLERVAPRSGRVMNYQFIRDHASKFLQRDLSTDKF